ncbi:MAG: SGNH hydrolase domain-containing protein, partial [Mycobacteriales bacterium]
AVPANLEPSLERVRRDKARPFLDGCHNEFVQTTVPRCVYGDPAGTKTIVLFGDSHATQWFPTLERIAKARHWKLVSLTKSTCPAVSIPVFSPYLRRMYRECDTWRSNALARIRAEKPAIVVLSVARHYDSTYRFEVYGAKWNAGLADMVTKVRATGARALVLGPVVKPAMIVPDCVANNLRNALGCSPPLTRVNRAGIRAEATSVLAARGTYADATPWMCGPKICPVIVGNLLVFRDDNHISTPYAAWLGPVVAGKIDAALR